MRHHCTRVYIDILGKAEGDDDEYGKAVQDEAVVMARLLEEFLEEHGYKGRYIVNAKPHDIREEAVRDYRQRFIDLKEAGAYAHVVEGGMIWG